jgi:hypothetical protein
VGYYQLGRNKLKPLNDDDFLRAHWAMYFKYSRQTGRDYIRFLLDEQFTAQRVHRKVVHPVDLEQTDEQSWLQRAARVDGRSLWAPVRMTSGFQAHTAKAAGDAGAVASSTPCVPSAPAA